MDFHIKYTYHKMAIFQTVVDEGASTCVMSMTCWKFIGSPKVLPSPTLLTTFNFHSNRHNGIIHAFPICVGGNVVNVELEIVDSNLDYNILLGPNWFYAMDSIVSSLFLILCFPREGISVTIN